MNCLSTSRHFQCFYPRLIQIGKQFGFTKERGRIPLLFVITTNSPQHFQCSAFVDLQLYISSFAYSTVTFIRTVRPSLNLICKQEEEGKIEKKNWIFVRLDEVPYPLREEKAKVRRPSCFCIFIRRDIFLRGVFFSACWFPFRLPVTTIFEPIIAIRLSSGY